VLILIYTPKAWAVQLQASIDAEAEALTWLPFSARCFQVHWCGQAKHSRWAISAATNANTTMLLRLPAASVTVVPSRLGAGGGVGGRNPDDDGAKRTTA